MPNFFVSHATFLFVDRLTPRKECKCFEVCSLWRYYSEGVICWQIRMWRSGEAEFASREEVSAQRRGFFFAEDTVKKSIDRIKHRKNPIY